MLVDACHSSCSNIPAKSSARVRRLRAVSAGVWPFGYWPAPVWEPRKQWSSPAGRFAVRVGPVAGTIFVANARADAQGAGGTGPGPVTVDRPVATGDIGPAAVIARRVDGQAVSPLTSGRPVGGPTRRAQLSTTAGVELSKATPVVTVTIFYDAGGLAVDSAGDLWAGSGTRVVLLARSQLVHRNW
jgi:hypothetical protein